MTSLHCIHWFCPLLAPWKRRCGTRRCVCTTLVVSIVAVIAIAMAICVPYYGFYKPDQSKSISAHGSEKRTILLRNVTGLLFDKVTITSSDVSYETTPYLVSTSELDHISYRKQTVVIANSSASHFPVNHGVLKGDLGFPYTPLYFLPGDSLEYNICISTTSNDSSVFALVVAFNQEDSYTHFKKFPWPDYGSTTAYRRYYINVTKTTVCHPLSFTTQQHGYYYFNGVINSTSTNKTGQQVAYAYHVTNIYRTFNLSDPAVSRICPGIESATCDVSFGTTSYSILATILPRSEDVELFNFLYYNVTFGFRWPAIYVLVAAALVTVVPITVCLSCTVVELLLCLCNRNN